MWIDPDNTDHLIAGDDGGVWYSYDGGNTWWKAENLPISQFYHVSLDMDLPYHVYGGLQDNSSWVGDSAYPGGIANAQWENMYGGDGFWMFADTADPTYLYAESQGGEIGRVNRKTHEIRRIQPLAAYKEGKLRWNWNTPIHMSPTQKGTVYIGAQFLFRTQDHGQTWERISPDLTTNDPEKQKQEQSGGVTIDNSSAEMHATIYAIAESPKDPNLIWVGTDDGNLQLTRDGGKTWTNLAGNVPGLPKFAWVSSIEAGHFDAGTAYATFDLHTFGDMKPYVYRTTDFGKTWTALAPAEGSMKGYAHVVKEDLVNKDLLFVGTELGLWVSLDGGRQWAQYKGGEMPNVAVRDLAIHPRDPALVLATHGRGIWIVDDITPLRSLTTEMLSKRGHLRALGERRPADPRLRGMGQRRRGVRRAEPALGGPDRLLPAEAPHLRRPQARGLRTGRQEARRHPVVSKRRGLSRAGWSMRLKPPRVPTAASAAGGSFGPRVLPGTYTVRMTKDKNVYETKLQVVPDPRSKHTPEDRKAQFDLAVKLYGLLGDMTFAVDRINGVRSGLLDRAGKLPEGDPLAATLKTDAGQVDVIRKKIVATTEGGAITGEERLREYLTDLYDNVVFYEGRPSQTQVERTEALKRELADVVAEFDAWTTKELPGVNSSLAGKGMPPIELLTRSAWEKQGEEGGGAGGGTVGAEREGLFDKD